MYLSWSRLRLGLTLTVAFSAWRMYNEKCLAGKVSLWFLFEVLERAAQVLVLTLQESTRCCATDETFSNMERSLDWVAWEMRVTVSIDISVTPNFLAETIQSLVLKVAWEGRGKWRKVILWAWSTKPIKRQVLLFCFSNLPHDMT